MLDPALCELANAVEKDGLTAHSAAVAERLAEPLGQAPSESELETTDRLLLIVDRLFPGWSITIDGVASRKDGHWVVVLRRSSSRDNDPFVGIGKGADLRAAIASALLNALAHIG